MVSKLLSLPPGGERSSFLLPEAPSPRPSAPPLPWDLTLKAWSWSTWRQRPPIQACAGPQGVPSAQGECLVWHMAWPFRWPELRGQRRVAAAVDNGVSQAQRSAGTGGQHRSPCRGRSWADAGEPPACLGDSALGKEAGGYEVSKRLQRGRLVIS